jgi:predicted phage terminase large subunit-like protein
VRGAWPSFDPSAYEENWAIDALCEHLTAVTEGHIKRLLINYPPRGGKTSVASVSWPMWVWTRQNDNFLSGPQVRFLCGSYNDRLALKISNASRRLILSPWYQAMWGDRIKLTGDQNAKNQFDNTAGGSRIATSVGGSLLGIGGDVILVDDPHNTEIVESEAEREQVLTWWKELRTTRLNSPKESAIVVIMQRLAQEDVSGQILEGNDASEWVHCMIPMRHDAMRHCVTVLKRDEDGNPLWTWEDPRTADGELMWPDRFGPKEVKMLETELGPYMASGRLQQMPSPKGGGIIKHEWWQLYEAPDQILDASGGVVSAGSFPKFDYVIASADTAYTEKEENDPTGFTVWGVWNDPSVMMSPLMDANGQNYPVLASEGQPKALLIYAWRKRLELHGKDVPKIPGESEASYFKRASPEWGLVEWIAHSCRKFNVDTLLIEAKASGLSVAQEMRRLYANQPWMVLEFTPEGDKTARLYSVQAMFAGGLVWAPDRDWAQMVIDEVTAYPKHKFKDLTDSTSSALKYLRERGLLLRKEEWDVEQLERMRYRPEPKPLYPTA